MRADDDFVGKHALRRRGLRIGARRARHQKGQGQRRFLRQRKMRVYDPHAWAEN